MAKSKVGGTRAYIRGRIGSDVYSVGKNGKGVRQQVVRSLAEQVSNPRTSSQMFGRMVMSTVMQAVSALKPIIDHSFDGIPTGQPSISEFIRRNYALVKADATDHPNSLNLFGLNKYGEKGVKPGSYVLASGDVIQPSTLMADDSALLISGLTATSTVANYLTAAGISKGDYLTLVMISNVGGALYCRIKVKDSVEESTVLSTENLSTIFDYEGNAAVTPSILSAGLTFKFDEEGTQRVGAVIMSVKENGGWKHNNAVLSENAGIDFKADVALPTYPTGSEQFLNGGDL